MAGRDFLILTAESQVPKMLKIFTEEVREMEGQLANALIS